MEYKLYRLEFHGAVHFGGNSLEDGEYTFCADTLFSALCQEALKVGGDVLDDFYRCAKDGELLLSDAFPCLGGTYFIPKPRKRVAAEDRQGDSVLKKAYKNLRYIPAEAVGTYLAGDYDVLHAPDMRLLGKAEMKVSASIRGKDETEPYRIGTYYFYPGNGLYVIAGYQGQQAEGLLDGLMGNLSFCGIGGRRTSGMGRFTLSAQELPEGFRDRLSFHGGRQDRSYMTLSVSLPEDGELEEVLRGAEYQLCKRSGFVDSERYALQQMRKRDLYVFKAGSCFLTRFCGGVYDVSGRGGSHPVYRYAKPLFMGL